MVSRALHCKAAEAPLSYAQEQMWALYELDQGSAAYSCPAVQWLRGQMHAEILVAAVEQLGSVQQSLRSHYGYSADQSAATQWVPATEQWSIPVASCSQSSVAAALELLVLELGTVAELEHSVLRVLVVGLERGELWLLALNTHHIATDGVSHQVQWEQLRKAYSAVVEGEGVNLGGLELQYVDYAVWQRRWFGGSEGRLEEEPSPLMRATIELGGYG